MEHIDALIKELKDADDERQEAIKAELIAACQAEGGRAVRDHIESSSRSQVLLVQWELDEVLEATAPAPVAPPEPEPEPTPEEPEPASEDTEKPLTAADLDMVYDDPRGLVLHRTKDGKRWFATQVNPQTGQPQTFELHPQEIDQIKAQLAGSPYWSLGSGLA